MLGKEWNWPRIETTHLAQQSLGYTDAELVRAVQLVRRHLGDEWIDRVLLPGGELRRGAHPVLHVVDAGRRLEVIESIPNSEPLVKELRQDRSDSWAEASAIYLLSRLAPTAEMEARPTVQVPGGTRSPDLRLRLPGGPWLYVEVTQPGDSIGARKLDLKLQRLQTLISSVTPGAALELYFRREPTDEEIDSLLRTPHEVPNGVHWTRELPNGLGLALANLDRPGCVRLLDHSDEPPVPRLSAAICEGNTASGPSRQIVIRIPFTDTRVKKLIRDEAKQLPKAEPGLVMLYRASGGRSRAAWVSAIARCLGPNVHTRLVGACVFSDQSIGTPCGEITTLDAAFVPHNFSCHLAPEWMPWGTLTAW